MHNFGPSFGWRCFLHPDWTRVLTSSLKVCATVLVPIATARLQKAESQHACMCHPGHLGWGRVEPNRHAHVAILVHYLRTLRSFALCGNPYRQRNIFVGLRQTSLTFTTVYCTILYYTILYYTILYYTILYYTILYYTILYYTILYYTILYYTILYYTILYCCESPRAKWSPHAEQAVVRLLPNRRSAAAPEQKQAQQRRQLPCVDIGSLRSVMGN